MDGSAAVAVEAGATPPASGKKPSFMSLYWYAGPKKSVSEPTYRPLAVTYIVQAPEPRGLRPGFQDSGMPLAGSRAAMPARGTEPVPAES